MTTFVVEGEDAFDLCMCVFIINNIQELIGVF